MITPQMDPNLIILRPAGPSRSKHGRSYQACTNCRERKLKCTLSDSESSEPALCTRCQKEGTECNWAVARNKKDCQTNILGEVSGKISRTATFNISTYDPTQKASVGVGSGGKPLYPQCPTLFKSGRRDRNVRFAGVPISSDMELPVAMTSFPHQPPSYRLDSQTPQPKDSTVQEDFPDLANVLVYMPAAMGNIQVEIYSHFEVVEFLLQLSRTYLGYPSSSNYAQKWFNPSSVSFIRFLQQHDSMQGRQLADSSKVIHSLISPGEILRERRLAMRSVTCSLGSSNDGLGFQSPTLDSIDRSKYLDTSIVTMIDHIQILLFPSKDYTKSLIVTHKYTEEIQKFQPRLRGWWRDFTKLGVSFSMPRRLSIEYEYARIYVNSITLEAMVDRQEAYDIALPLLACSQNDSPTHPTNTSKSDLKSVNTLIEASRKLIGTFAEYCQQESELETLTSHLWTKMLHATILLLKTFSIVSTFQEVATSLKYIDEAVLTLRKYAPVFNSQYAPIFLSDIIDSLSNKICSNIVKFPDLVGCESQNIVDGVAKPGHISDGIGL